MELSKITPKKHERSFSILSGLLVGLFFVILFNLSGNGPNKFIIIFLNASFFTIATLSHYLASILLFSLAINNSRNSNLYFYYQNVKEMYIRWIYRHNINICNYVNILFIWCDRFFNLFTGIINLRTS